MKVIAYSYDNQVVVIHPTNLLPIQETARKDVPFGCPYKILDVTELPPSNLFREAWELDSNNPDGYGANYGFGGSYQLVGYTENFEPIIKPRK